MKPLPVSESKECSPETQRTASCSNSKTKPDADYWFDVNGDYKTIDEYPAINEMYYDDYPLSPKYDRLPIGWTLSSHEGEAVYVPMKFYKDSPTPSGDFFTRPDTSSSRSSPDGNSQGEAKEYAPLNGESENSREQQFLNSLEFAEIKFLQPDSIQYEHYRHDIGYEKKLQENGLKRHEEQKADAYYRSASGSYTYSPLRAAYKKINDDNTDKSDQNRTNGYLKNNINGSIYIQNSKYKRGHPVFAKILSPTSSYTKGDYNHGSMKILTSGRQHFSSQSQSLSTCKCHPEKIASLYCTSCQVQTCNICFFDRHQHCTLRMSKEAIHHLAKYLQEKLYRTKKLKAQLESWLSFFEGEVTRIDQRADEIISYMTDMLRKKRALFKEEIEKIRESPPVQRMQDSYSECAELEDRLTVYLQDLRWSSQDSYVVQPFLQSNVPSLHMPNSAELHSIRLLKPVLQPNAFVVRSFLEMQNHSLGSIQLQYPIGPTGIDMKIATGSHLSGQKLSHKMENILEKCLPFLPLKLCVFGTVTGNEFSHPDAVDSIVFLPNKCTLLSDPSNMKVKMVSFQGQRLGEITFESSPNGLCLWNTNVAATAVSHIKKIYFLNCDNGLTIRSAVSTNKEYWGLTAGEIEQVPCLLAATQHSSTVDILKYDDTASTLTVLKCIVPPTLEKWGSVCNLCFTTKSIIVVADCLKSRVIGFSLEGEVLFEFPGSKEELLKCPADVTADDQYIYISDIGNNRILKLGHDGTFHGVVLTAQDGLLRPKGIDIDAHGHLVVSQFTEWPALLIFMTRF